MRVVVAIFVVSAVLILASTGRAQQKDPFDESPFLTMYQLLPKAYKMTPEQKDQFETLMQQLVEEYHGYLIDKADQVDKLRAEYDQLQQIKAAGGEVPRTQLQMLLRRRGAMIQASPLGINTVQARVEAFLPPEQVAVAKGLSPQPTTTQAVEQPVPVRVIQPATKPTAAVTTAAPRRPRSRLTFKPAQSWPRLVEGFIVRRGLDEQSAQRARSLLHELRRRARQYHQRYQHEYETAGRITDVAVRRELLDRLEEPVGKLFDQLRSRLEALADENTQAKTPPPNQ